MAKTPRSPNQMFQRRLQWFGLLLGCLALVIAARLVDIQVVHSGHYQALGDELLVRPDIYIPAPRGTIRDRHGEPLLRDEATWDISVHYQVLTFTDREQYLRSVARQMQRRGTAPDDMTTAELVTALQADVARMWEQLEDLTGKPVDEIVAAADYLKRRVEIIRRAVEARTGNKHVLEERMFHPVVEGLDAELTLAARLELEKYPWVRVAPSSRRVARDADAFAHILGRTGEASAVRIAEDPLKSDILRRLRPGDRCGTSGVERMAETTLRGTRGRIARDADGNVIERIEPQAGDDVWLTLDHDLQQKTLELLAEAVTNSPAPSGAAAVVLDTATRDVLALVSYPTYRYDTFREDYVALRRDTKNLPIRARAVSAAYPPGSTCKAITLVGALSDGVVSPHDEFACAPGYLLPNNRDRYRCWIYNQHLMHHPLQNAEEAVMNSCNMYFYKVGGKIGADRLCDWFHRFGLGETQGTGLIEESDGILPTSEWLRARGRDREQGHAWIYAIGQGDVVATPLQVANVAASIGSDRWEPVRFARNENGVWINPRNTATVSFRDDALRTLRTGMWRVVNDRRGTGKNAQLDVPGYEMCGKTGSAQAMPHIVRYRYVMEWPDGRREDVLAETRADALLHFEDAESPPKIVGRFAAERYPKWQPGERLPAHAWFMGYTQADDTTRGDRPRGQSYAISVLVEFGGSGGAVAAPVAKQIAEYLLTRDKPLAAEG